MLPNYVFCHYHLQIKYSYIFFFYVAFFVDDKIVLLLGESLENFINSGRISPHANMHNFYALGETENNRDRIVALFGSVEKVVVGVPYHLLRSSSQIVWWPLVLATQLQRRVHLIGTSQIGTI